MAAQREVTPATEAGNHPSAASSAGPCALPDPVLVEGRRLAQLLGKPIGSLRLYRIEQGAFLPIRFQVDERTEEGDWIFPEGKKNNGWRSNGRLDPQDVLVFMAKDAGGPVLEAAASPLPGTTVPIGLADPEHGAETWVFLVSHDGPPPPLSNLPAYVRYDPENETVSSRAVDEAYLITEEGLHTSFYTRASSPVGAGGSGENYVDRLKFRVEVRFFFGLIPLRISEESLGSEIVAYIRGPVRVLRRQEQFVKLPLGGRGVGGYADIAHYESMGIVPIELKVPWGIHRITSSVLFQYGTDYAPTVIGSFFRNSENPEPLIIDARMSPAERRFNARQDSWRIFYGPTGAMVTRTMFPPDLLEMIEVSQQYTDDLQSPLPTERFPGSVGFAWTEIVPTKIRSGRYRIALDFYHPMRYRPGDERAFLRMRDHPLRIRIGEDAQINPLDLHAEVGEDF